MMGGIWSVSWGMVASRTHAQVTVPSIFLIGK
jgi:hypothetical protein